jgi:hypothetical protein
VIDLAGPCARHRSALLDFVDRGEIVPGTAQALAHLERCNRCTDELESTVLAITALRRYGDDIARLEPSPEAWSRLRARLDSLRPRRWVIMSPTAGVMMSFALVAVLVAPLRIGGPVPSAAPARPSVEDLGVSLAELRTEAAYLANIGQGTFPKAEPATRPVITFPRNYPDNIHPDRKEVTPAEPSGKPPEAI